MSLSFSPTASNQPPRFQNYFFQSYLLIYEDTPVGTSITQLQAIDPDGEPLIYGVVGEEAMRYFAVQGTTGVVWLRQPLDRETKSEMQVEFSVSDSQGHSSNFNLSPSPFPIIPLARPLLILDMRITESPCKLQLV
ncbi:cadherin-23-like isoform X1 [Labeo rohita]|uniref:Cadherin-23-like isoform X1 n=1 Tax=Labeo rohita TaxID=84645 RepID=A0A498M9Y9_LABRO|nr:cadherin-23-like isoform X1 [Labeo rohita]